MDNLFVDLHIHTNFSDGSFSPEKVVRDAYKAGFLAISITDHDTTNGIEPALTVGKEYGIEIIPGVELSCERENSPGGEIHILGYYIEWKNKHFQEKLKVFQEARRKRAHEILNKLFKLNVVLDEGDLFENTGKSSIGRMHFAKMLVEQGYVSNTRESFERYLAYGKPAFVPKIKIEPKEAIKMILDINGIPVVAHPQIGADDKKIIQELKENGLAGIEVFSGKHNEETISKYQQWATELNLLTTGGSDFHGGTTDIGKIKISYNVVNQLKEYRKNITKK